MASPTDTVWICKICGYEHVGDSPPAECPVCGAGAEDFEQKVGGDAETEPAAKEPAAPSSARTDLGEYLAEWARPTDDFESRYAHIVALARGEGSEVSPMRTQRSFPDWDTILFKGAQLHRLPLNDDEPVALKTVIGTTAARPLELAIPFYISHMSFGALSREAKIALATGAKAVGTAIGSGEGGLLPDERAAADRYVYELGTAPFSHREEAMKQAEAVEIKIGQAAKPGMGGHLPAEKVTPEIGAIRGIAPGEDSISPGRHTGIDSVEDLVRRVAEVREVIGDRPVGVKITAGHIEEDLACVLRARPDFVTIDCRGGATGAALSFVKDNVCVPPVFAIRRARRFLDEAGSAITLCVTGGFRDATDIAKGLALGADAIALATASLIAIGCQQYRICHTGRCPVGITTQDPKLRARFEIEKSVQRLVNFYEGTAKELRILARINGRSSVHDLDLSDVMTISSEVAQNTDIAHV